MLPRLLVVVLDELLEPAAAQSVQVPLFATDDRNDRAVGATHERHQWCQLEVPADLHLVRDRLRQGKRAPEVVEPGREDRQATGAVALEVVVEPTGDALPVRFQRAPLLVREVLALRLRRGSEERVHPSLRIACGRNVAWVEVHVETGGAAVLGAEARKLPQKGPGHRASHTPPLPTINAAILCMRMQSSRLGTAFAPRSS